MIKAKISKNITKPKICFDIPLVSYLYLPDHPEFVFTNENKDNFYYHFGSKM